MNHQSLPDEPSSGWALLTRLAFVGCLLLLFGGLAVMLIPELKALRATDAHIGALNNTLADLQKKKEKMESTSVLLSHDKDFVEYTARDTLGMKKPDETIFHFPDRKPTH